MMFNSSMMNTFPYMMNYQQPKTDIGQVNSEQEAVNAYVAAGCSKILFTPDDRTVFVKSVSMNGQVSMDIFDRRAPAPAVPEPEYVTKAELAAAIEALKAPKRTTKKEEPEE